VFHPWLILVLRAAAAFAALAVATQASAAAEASKTSAKSDTSPGAVRTAFALADAAGKKHSTAEWKGEKAVVLFFIATECPVSNFYSPDFARIAGEYREKAVVTYGVHCDADLTAVNAAAHAKEYGLKFPMLLDPKQKLAAAVGARKTPEAFVLTPDGKVLYHGRIDDRFSTDGKRRDEPSKHELEDAIRAVVAGKTPEVKEAAPYGCPLPKDK
jgi:peroxiredoxin